MKKPSNQFIFIHFRFVLFRTKFIVYASGAAAANRARRIHQTKSDEARSVDPMRDGVKLFTSIYEPKTKAEKYPILLNRTPYTVAPYDADKF
jgi:predicted acyl esterase